MPSSCVPLSVKLSSCICCSRLLLPGCRCWCCCCMSSSSSSAGGSSPSSWFQIAAAWSRARTTGERRWPCTESGASDSLRRSQAALLEAVSWPNTCAKRLRRTGTPRPASFLRAWGQSAAGTAAGRWRSAAGCVQNKRLCSVHCHSSMKALCCPTYLGSMPPPPIQVTGRPPLLQPDAFMDGHCCCCCWCSSCCCCQSLLLLQLPSQPPNWCLCGEKQHHSDRPSQHSLARRRGAVAGPCPGLPADMNACVMCGKPDDVPGRRITLCCASREPDSGLQPSRQRRGRASSQHGQREQRQRGRGWHDVGS